MTDLDIKRSSELMVAQVEGTSKAGAEFVDAWFPHGGLSFHVVDSGRIIVQEPDLDALLADAAGRGLSYTASTLEEE